MIEVAQHLNVLDGQARRQRLLQLVSLLLVLDAQGVEVLAAANLELDDVFRLLNLHGCADENTEAWAMSDYARPHRMRGVQCSHRKQCRMPQALGQWQ